MLCLICLGTVGQALAEEEIIQVAVPPFAPFAFFNENTKCEGASIAILNKLASETGLKFGHVKYPYARILSSLKNGQLDLALIFKNDSIKNSVHYIGPVSQSRVVVLTRTKNSISAYEDLAKLKHIAVIRKANFEARFDKDSRLNKVPVESYLQAIQMFKLNRVEAVVGSVSGLEYAMQELRVNVNLVKSAYQLGQKEWWLHLSKKYAHPDLIARITKAVEKIYQPDLTYQVYKQQINHCLKDL